MILLIWYQDHSPSSVAHSNKLVNLPSFTASSCSFAALPFSLASPTITRPSACVSSKAHTAAREGTGNTYFARLVAVEAVLVYFWVRRTRAETIDKER